MQESKSRIIIDTNLWISLLLTRNYTRIDQLLANRSVTLIFSEELLTEFMDVARRTKFRKYFSLDDLQELLYELRARMELVTVSSVVTDCRDPNDNFLLSLALDGQATHLITGDKDLLDLQSFGYTRILTIADYSLLQ